MGHEVICDYDDGPVSRVRRELHGFIVTPGKDPVPVWSIPGVTVDPFVFVGQPWQDPDELIQSNLYVVQASPYFRRPDEVDMAPRALREGVGRVEES